MSMTTWTQYVSMEDRVPEPGLLDAALNSLEDWDEDFAIGGAPAVVSGVPG